MSEILQLLLVAFICEPGDLTYTVEVDPMIAWHRGDREYGPDQSPLEVAAELGWSLYAVLNHPQGWGGVGVHFCPVPLSSDRADVHIFLADPVTVDEACAPIHTAGEVSCQKGDYAVINARRWWLGAGGWEERLGDYRRYLITHEVGHVLGMIHRYCPEDPEKPTPVMAQQSNSRARCSRSPWPTTSELRSLRRRLETR